MIAATLLYLLAGALLASTYVAARGGLGSDEAGAILSMEPEAQRQLAAGAGSRPTGDPKAD